MIGIAPFTSKKTAFSMAPLRSALLGGLLAFGLSACSLTGGWGEDTAQMSPGDSQLVSASSVSDVDLIASDIAEAEDSGEDLDPFETVNRFMFAINETLDVFILRPIAVTYRDWAPEGVKDSIANFLSNLALPWTFVNDILQGNLDRAEVSGGRFLVNTAIGFGFFDHATGLGLEYHEEDFGQTLGAHGAGPGAYVVLPILGPSTVRDTFGLVVDNFLDPVNVISRAADADWVSPTRGATRGVVVREQLLDDGDDLMRDSLDPYARVRSVYLQFRDAKVRNMEGKDNPLTIQESQGLERE